MRDEISRRTLIIAIVVCATLLIAVPAAALYFLDHHESLSVSTETAEAEFARLRARFVGHRPLVDMASRSTDAADGADTADGSSAPRSIRAFHTVIFDTGSRPRLLHLTAPVGFARLFADRAGLFLRLGELTFLDNTEFDQEPIRVSIDEIRRHGPGLLVDCRHPGGGQFIAWVE